MSFLWKCLYRQNKQYFIFKKKKLLGLNNENVKNFWFRDQFYMQASFKRLLVPTKKYFKTRPVGSKNFEIETNIFSSAPANPGMINNDRPLV